MPRRDGDQVLVTCNGGSGGTLVNGKKVQRQPLKPGDVLQVGDTQLRLQLGDLPLDVALAQSAGARTPAPGCAARVERADAATQVAAYRELCRSVQRSGRENVVFALLMLGFTYFIHTTGAPPLFVLVFAGLAVGELLVGLFKWMVPSAEGLILDGIVLLVFAAFNLLIAYQRFQCRGGSPRKAG